MLFVELLKKKNMNLFLRFFLTEKKDNYITFNNQKHLIVFLFDTLAEEADILLRDETLMNA